MTPRPRRRVVIGQDRETRLGRRAPTLDQRRSVLVVTNGEVTEQIYLRGLTGDKKVDGRFVVKFVPGWPRQVVDAAERLGDPVDANPATAMWRLVKRLGLS